nr:nucleotide exchange factor GrpE [Bacillus alkalicellulosilyticus]
MNRLEQKNDPTVELVEDETVDANGEQQEAETTEEVIEEVVTEEQQKMNELEKQVQGLNEKLLRVHADYDNLRRRTKSEKEAAAKYRAQSLVEELLPVLDNFERALQVTVEQDETKSLLQGMEMVYRQLHDALTKEGVEVIPAEGELFDPHLHQAVMQIDSPDHEKNQVVEELQKGYRLKDRVIRPSMVKVNA